MNLIILKELFLLRLIVGQDITIMVTLVSLHILSIIIGYYLWKLLLFGGPNLWDNLWQVFNEFDVLHKLLSIGFDNTKPNSACI